MSAASVASPILGTAADGATIAVHEVSRKGRFEQAVILTHGTFSNGSVCLRLARAIAAEGFATYVLDWREHGSSPAGRHRASKANFETVALNDGPLALEIVAERSGKPRVFWVGHSGGGFLPTMLLARQPAHRTRFAGIVSLATQAAGAGKTVPKRLQIAFAAALTGALGRVPGRALGLGVHDETARMMNQWYRWNWTGRWLGDDGFDYAASVRDLEVPILSFAARGDRFIAPPQGCRGWFDTLGSLDKQFVECGLATGFSEDFDHSRIIASRAAMKEVWPRLIAWLVERASVAALQ